MNASINPSWVEVSKQEFVETMFLLDWRREGWGNGIIYFDYGRRKPGCSFWECDRIGIALASGKYLLDPRYRKS